MQKRKEPHREKGEPEGLGSPVFLVSVFLSLHLHRLDTALFSKYDFSCDQSCMNREVGIEQDQVGALSRGDCAFSVFKAQQSCGILRNAPDRVR